MILALENLLTQSYAEPGALAIAGRPGVPVFVREPGFTARLDVEALY